MLIVLAMLGILFAIAAPRFSTPTVRLAANSLHQFIQGGRFESVKANAPMILKLDVAAGTATFHPSVTGTGPCVVSTAAVSSFALHEYRNVTFSSSLDGPVMQWLPNGQLRPCSGVSVPLAISVSDGERQLSVAMSTAGGISIHD